MMRKTKPAIDQISFRSWLEENGQWQKVSYKAQELPRAKIEKAKYQMIPNQSAISDAPWQCPVTVQALADLKEKIKYNKGPEKEGEEQKEKKDKEKEGEEQEGKKESEVQEEKKEGEEQEEISLKKGKKKKDKKKGKKKATENEPKDEESKSWANYLIARDKSHRGQNALHFLFIQTHLKHIKISPLTYSLVKHKCD